MPASPSPEPLQPLLVSLYLSCGLVGRIAELLSLMDSPMRGRLSRPVPEHVMQVWGEVCGVKVREIHLVDRPMRGRFTGPGPEHGYLEQEQAQACESSTLPSPQAGRTHPPGENPE